MRRIHEGLFLRASLQTSTRACRQVTLVPAVFRENSRKKKSCRRWNTEQVQVQVAIETSPKSIA